MEFGKKNQRLEYWCILCVTKVCKYLQPIFGSSVGNNSYSTQKFQMQEGCYRETEFGNYSLL